MADVTTTELAEVVPNLTVDVGVKRTPSMTTFVPPASGPCEGATEWTSAVPAMEYDDWWPSDWQLLCQSVPVPPPIPDTAVAVRDVVVVPFRVGPPSSRPTREAPPMSSRPGC